ncbi:hypothetical protein HK096_007571, partial [Nowakowskiella sp. JEL0078]
QVSKEEYKFRKSKRLNNDDTPQSSNILQQQAIRIPTTLYETELTENIEYNASRNAEKAKQKLREYQFRKRRHVMYVKKLTKTIVRRKVIETQQSLQDVERKLDDTPIQKDLLLDEKQRQNWGIGFGISAVAIAIGLTSG